MTEIFGGEEGPTGVNRATLCSARVIVVDDDDDMRRLITSALRGDGHDVIEAASGVDALGRITSMALAGLGYPDVIVTDIRMRGVNGLALIAGLRVAGCASPVVVMTAFASAAFRDNAERLGAAAFFSKPFDIDDLRTTVVNLSLSTAALRAT
jgi:two-component system response regulator (stage 0 sporulation protein F)